MAKKINKLSDVKKLTAEINSARKSLLNLRFQKSTGQLEKTSEIKKSAFLSVLYLFYVYPTHSHYS